MFIVTGLDKVLAAPKERNVGEANRCSKHFAPMELLSLGYLRIYKHWAPPELMRLVADKPRCVTMAEIRFSSTC